MATEEQWLALTGILTEHDRVVCEAGIMATPKTWALKQPQELCGGSAIVGAHFERKFIAEMIRNVVVLAERDPEVKALMDEFEPLNRIVMLFDQKFLDLAQALEDGTYVW